MMGLPRSPLFDPNERLQRVSPIELERQQVVRGIGAGAEEDRQLAGGHTRDRHRDLEGLCLGKDLMPFGSPRSIDFDVADCCLLLQQER